MNGLEPALQTLSSWMASASETLSIILNQGVTPDAASHSLLTVEELRDKAWDGVVFPARLFGGVEGELQLLLNRGHANTLIDLLVGGTGVDSSEELTELHHTVLQEAVQQVVAGLSDQLTHLRGQAVKIRLSPALTALRTDGGGELRLWWDCPLSLEEGPGLGFSVLCPASVVAQLGPNAVEAPARPPRGHAHEGPRESIERPRFNELKPTPENVRKGHLELILDVPLQVQVVLGRTTMMVQELIHLGEGSILELDKLAGEPVELFVNDRMVAYGEVIVIDERFGVKVLELASDRRPLKPASSL
ncbi:flagellar motor switch protein FliN [bacterium]|nr:flagellar motor switch protein FliN [bacterium]